MLRSTTPPSRARAGQPDSPATPAATPIHLQHPSPDLPHHGGADPVITLPVSARRCRHRCKCRHRQHAAGAAPARAPRRFPIAGWVAEQRVVMTLDEIGPACRVPSIGLASSGHDDPPARLVARRSPALDFRARPSGRLGGSLSALVARGLVLVLALLLFWPARPLVAGTTRQFVARVDPCSASPPARGRPPRLDRGGGGGSGGL